MLEAPPSPWEVELFRCGEEILGALGHVLARGATNDPLVPVLERLKLTLEGYPRELS